MKGVTINLKDWELFEDDQVEKIRKVCSDSVEYCVDELFKGAEASIELEGEALYLNFHDADFENYFGRIGFEDIFNTYTDPEKIPTQESKLRAIKMRDTIEGIVKAIDKAIKDA